MATIDPPARTAILSRIHGIGSSRRARKIGIAFIVLFILFSVTGFFILPPYVKQLATEKLGEQLGRPVGIGAVSINPYNLSTTIRDFEIKEADGKTTFVSFGSLYVNLEIMSIIRGGPVVREVRLEKPFLHLVRTGPNTYNFSDIIERFRARGAAAPPEPAGKPLAFSLANIQIAGGAIEFDDRPVSTRHDIKDLNFNIPFISNLPSYIEAFVQPSLSATVNGTPFSLTGATKVFHDSHETSLDILLKDIDLPYYLSYIPTQLNLKVESGKLDIGIKASYREFADRAPLIVLAGEWRLRDFRAGLRNEKEPFLGIPMLSMKDISADMETQKIEIGSISTEKGMLSAIRRSDGSMNLASVTSGTRTRDAERSSEADASASQWTTTLKSLSVEGYTLKVNDRTLEQPFAVTIDEIACKAQGISTAKDSKAEVAFSARVARTGSASAEGSVMLNPVGADLKINLKAVPLKPVQPYLEDRVQLILASGSLNLNGTVSAGLNAREELATAFKGKIWVNKLSLLDKNKAEDLLKWDTLYLGEMNVRNAPLFVHIREISLTKFYSRIIINADRTINLQQVMARPQAEEETGQQPAEEPVDKAAPPAKPGMLRNIKIDRITLQGGTINLTDNFIKPSFSGNLLEIGGRITGLTSDENSLGEVELRGKYDRYAPLEITGKINPLREDLYVELKADFKEMDLTGVNPYSGRYAGYTIEKGKLSFQLEYLIVKNALDAKNTIFLDQFTLGDRVESPDATKLPVKLAVALLKNRRGEIKLDIPVSGSLDDPQFSIGSVILKIIVNLLVKAATSPFALLGAIFGGGEQLSYAEFEYGSAELTAETKKKLDTIVKALHDRPGLKMDIEGHADPENDREGLKRYMMLRKVKTQKVKDLSKKGTETPSLEAVTVLPEEYPEYLKRAYREERFPKPRNIIGMQKDLPVAEMEKLMLTNAKVTEEDMKTLATDRARAVRDYLLASGLIEQERIFMIEPKAVAAEKKEGIKGSRADFRLK